MLARDGCYFFINKRKLYVFIPHWSSKEHFASLYIGGSTIDYYVDNNTMLLSSYWWL